MRAISRLFLFVLLVAGQQALARLPETKSEQSLLYWRYLCRNEPQREVASAKVREFSCPSEGWTVKADQHGKVKEIIK